MYAVRLQRGSSTSCADPKERHRHDEETPWKGGRSWESTLGRSMKILPMFERCRLVQLVTFPIFHREPGPCCRRLPISCCFWTVLVVGNLRRLTAMQAVCKQGHRTGMAAEGSHLRVATRMMNC